MNSKFQQGSGVNLRSRLKAAGYGSANARYLNGLTSQMKDKILNNVASHYEVSVDEIEQELTDNDAEPLYEYITGDKALQMQCYNSFKKDASSDQSKQAGRADVTGEAALRSSLIRLAHTNPSLRPHLLPLLTASFDAEEIGAPTKGPVGVPGSDAQKPWAKGELTQQENSELGEKLEDGPLADGKADLEPLKVKQARAAYRKARLAGKDQKEATRIALSESRVLSKARELSGVSEKEGPASHVQDTQIKGEKGWRVLFWKSEEDAENDDGKKAIAEVTFTDKDPEGTFKQKNASNQDKQAASVDPEFRRLAGQFLAYAQDTVDTHMREKFPTLARKILTLEWGQRYARIVVSSEGSKTGSAFGFIDITNGDLLKASTWKAPAKIPRGNLYDKSTWGRSHDSYGMAYLR